MRLKSNWSGRLAEWIGLGLMLAAAAQAEIVYDNSATPVLTSEGIPRAQFSVAEFGDEIQLRPGLARIVTQFLFEYYGDFIKQGDERVRVRFYENNGRVAGTTQSGQPILAPGRLLYDSGPKPLEPGYHSMDLPGLDVTVPDSFTWSVQFLGLSGNVGDRAGLLLYHPPTVGASFTDFWLLVDQEWQGFLIRDENNRVVPANFGARVIAVVPEPTTMALAGLGALLLLGAHRWRRPE